MTAPSGKGPMPPFALVRNFLSQEQHAGLLEWALASGPLLEASTIGAERRVDPASRLSRSLTISSAHQPWRDMLRRRIGEAEADLFAGAGLKPFPVAKVELELVVYLNGAHFEAHQDTHRKGNESASDRGLTGVYYFYAEPKGFSGGNLRLIRFGCGAASPGDFVEIEPEQNSLLVFPSWAMHEVTPVRCESDDLRSARLAINCWLHRARRTAAQQSAQ
ncbi:MAG TPA: 2OG-Fe(II) oxygenase [Allosphingosinicella sp.]|jgi:Rps23 Pro-64 3,4-dihydroxylase Tpa1-like proline 4-hydroxylase